MTTPFNQAVPYLGLIHVRITIGIVAEMKSRLSQFPQCFARMRTHEYPPGLTASKSCLVSEGFRFMFDFPDATFVQEP
jgi:hypothetical protein